MMETADSSEKTAVRLPYFIMTHDISEDWNPHIYYENAKSHIKKVVAPKDVLGRNVVMFCVFPFLHMYSEFPTR